MVVVVRRIFLFTRHVYVNVSGSASASEPEAVATTTSLGLGVLLLSVTAAVGDESATTAVEIAVALGSVPSDTTSSSVT